MRIVRPATEREVAETFVRAELASERFGARVRELVERYPDDPLTVLGEHRGWGRNERMFTNFPAAMEWSRVALTPEEVLSVLYIDWGWWLTISDGTRSPVTAAIRIRAEGDEADLEFNRAIAARLETDDPPPELILISDRVGSRLVVIEGHVRLTAYAVFPEYLPAELEVYLGVADDLSRWTSY